MHDGSDSDYDDDGDDDDDDDNNNNAGSNTHKLDRTSIFAQLSAQARRTVVA
jgi:hypothetical protein